LPGQRKFVGESGQLDAGRQARSESRLARRTFVGFKRNLAGKGAAAFLDLQEVAALL